MKRFWIILLAIAMALVIALPAGAGKPDCDPDSLTYTQFHPACGKDDPEPPPPVEEVACAFDTSGVLLSGTDGDPIALGGESISYRCRLIASPSDSFEFAIGTTDGATTLLQPLIAVTDAYPSGDMCFREFEVGRMTTDLVGGAGTFVTFSMGGDPLTESTDGECDDYMGTSFVNDGMSDVYTLTFQTGKAKGGTVHLTMTDAPVFPPTESD